MRVELGAAAARVHWQSPPPRDAALAAGLCVLDFGAFAELPDHRVVAVIAYGIVGYVALAWRRAAPLPVFLLLWFHHLGAALWIPDYRPTLGIIVALYTVAAMLDRRTSVAALLASFVTTTTAASQQELGSNPAMSPVSIVLFVTILYAMLSIGAWALGRWVQHSRLAMDQLEERRRRAATEAVTAERQRIARELHDIVSHSVSVIVLQAAGARRVLASDRARAEKALAHIEGIGKESMVELRRLLGVLHDGVSADDERELGPQPGLTDLTSLVEGVRAGGLAVQMTVNGTPARLDPSVDLSAYRIVQEALTNSIKHGGGRAHATVTLDWTTELQIEVTDDGGPAADPALSTGHGLLGLKERARAVGGHLEAGPLERGGFRIRASLPLAQSGRPDARESALHQG